LRLQNAVFNVARASISQDYWGDIKEDWGSGDGSPPAGWRGRAQVGGLGDVSPESETFFVKLHINICIKIQQTTVAVTRVDILNDITSKIFRGGHYHGCPPSCPHVLWGSTPLQCWIIDQILTLSSYLLILLYWNLVR